MKAYWTLMILFTGGLAAAAGAARAAQSRTYAHGAETAAAAHGEDKTYDQVFDTVTSPDGKRTAFIAKRGDKWLVVIDGVEGKEYDGVQRLHFSADGSRVGYLAEFPDSHAVVIDGVEGKHYIGGVRDLVFSPDGKHAAFVAGRGTPFNNHIDDVVVIDGVEGTPFHEIEPGSLRYSPDGKHLAFAAHVPAYTVTGFEGRVFLDGKPISGGFDRLIQGPDDEAVLQFSPDGRHVAYLFSRGETRSVGVDGREGKGYAYVKPDSIRFSPDGRRVAYVAEVGRVGAFGVCGVVADGKEGPAYDEISDLQFDADGSHFTYVGRRGDKTFHVTDRGEESPIP